MAAQTNAAEITYEQMTIWERILIGFGGCGDCGVEATSIYLTTSITNKSCPFLPCKAPDTIVVSNPLVFQMWFTTP